VSESGEVGQAGGVEGFLGVPMGAVRLLPGESGSVARGWPSCLAEAIRWSSLPGRESFAEGMNWPSWSAFFRQLTDALPSDRTSVLVIDELPWLLEADPALEGELQTAWDRGGAGVAIFQFRPGLARDQSSAKRRSADADLVHGEQMTLAVTGVAVPAVTLTVATPGWQP
jgi:hypothetical protein